MILETLKSWSLDFIHLFYPNNCLTCYNPLVRQEKIICLHCETSLPITGYHYLIENPVKDQFLGRIPIQFATAIYQFTKSSKIQIIMHALKYEGNQPVGIKLGNLIADRLSPLPMYDSIDYIVPVPLHKNKLYKRGYNQAELIAKGMSDVWHKKMRKDLVIRIKANPSQITQTRYSRWDNVEGIFQCQIKCKSQTHILLVDDVVTTGSTLEACAKALIDSGYTVSLCAAATALR